MTDEDDEQEEGAPVEIPIDGILDLHPFPPGETAEVVAAYLDECLARGIREIRLIHGKGTGTQRAIVASALRANPLVASFCTAPESEGGWGATKVFLK